MIRRIADIGRTATMKRLALALSASGLLAALAGPAMAQIVTLEIATSEVVEEHYPGPDGLIGTADDFVSGLLSEAQQSEPNFNGSYGFNAFSFSGGQQSDPRMPTGYDAITFVEGEIKIDLAEVIGGGPLITALDIFSGTEPFPGHGPYSSAITAVNGGDYDAASGAFTLDVDISYTINGQVAMEPGVVLTGEAFYQRKDQYAFPRGVDYLDNVAVPLAQARDAEAVVTITATGQLPNLGYPISTSLIALASEPASTFQINEGLNDAWLNRTTPLTGFFIYVFPDKNLVFLSWFTFDTTRPPADQTAVIGGPGQRWITAQGPYDGDTATLDVFLTQGGVFDSATPLPTTDPAPIGTITVEWSDCNNALLTYNFAGLTAEVPIERVSTQNVKYCEAINEGTL